MFLFILTWETGKKRALRSPLDGQPSHPGAANFMTHPFPIILLPNLTSSKAHFSVCKYEGRQALSTLQKLNTGMDQNNYIFILVK